VINVKKRLLLFLCVSMMALSFAVPVMAVETVVLEPVNISAEQGITPDTEMTRIFWRTYNGQLQWRVWSITNGRWLTDWANA
jgi:hypothetical protein